MRYKSVSLLLLIAALTSFAQEPSIQIAASAERLRSHITYLASDALEGRRTGTPGANAAAQYIAGEFSRLGLRPAKSTRAARGRGEAQSSYLQQFPYVSGVTLGKGNMLSLKTSTAGPVELRLNDDWAPLGFSSNVRLQDAQVAFAGYGISSAELKYDDYAVSSAKDRVAVVFAGTPDGNNPHGRFARAGEIRFKAAAARSAGARALIVISNEKSLKDDRLSRLAYDNAGDAGIPVLVVSRQAAVRILDAPDADLSNYEKTADAGTGSSKENQCDIFSAVPLRIPLGGLRLNLSTDILRRQVAASNVIGILDGSNPGLKSETIVIGAHYDHLGRGGAGSLAQQEGELHPGADDNASGVAGMLELARVLAAQRPGPRRTIVFIAFSGEEEGLLGSNYYVNHPVVPIANTVAMLNMDMIGRMRNKNLIVGGVGTAQEWGSMVESANLLKGIAVTSKVGSSRHPTPSLSNLPLVVTANGRTVVSSDATKQFLLTLNEDGYGPSDHSSFYAKKIPVLFFWTGTHEDYHKPSDTAEKINYEDEVRILAMLKRIVYHIDASDKSPSYTVAKNAAPGRSTGFRVYLGTIPNYAGGNDGLLLDGVREDSPAANAGLKAGDRIVKLAGREVRNLYDYTFALGEMKAGQEYEVEILRAIEHLKFKLTPALRK